MDPELERKHVRWELSQFHHCLKASLLSTLYLNVLFRSHRRQWEWIISCPQWWLLVTLMWSNGIRGQQGGQARYSQCNYSIKPNISGPGQWWMAFLKASRIRAFGSDGCSLFRSPDIKLSFLMDEVKLVYKATEATCHGKQLRRAGSDAKLSPDEWGISGKEKVGTEVDAGW